MAVALDALSSKPVLLHPTSAGSASFRESVTPESEQMVSSTFDAPYTIVKDLLSDVDDAEAATSTLTQGDAS